MSAPAVVSGANWNVIVTLYFLVLLALASAGFALHNNQIVLAASGAGGLTATLLLVREAIEADRFWVRLSLWTSAFVMGYEMVLLVSVSLLRGGL